MTKKEFYALASKIYYTFEDDNNEVSSKVIYNGTHAERIMSGIGAGLYKLDKATATILCLYVNYKYSPRSLTKMFDYLKTIEVKEITRFKLDLQQYLRTYKNEILKIENSVEIIDIRNLIQMYLSKEINFITFYYSIKKFNLEQEVLKSRIYSMLYSKIRPLMLLLSKASKVSLEV